MSEDNKGGMKRRDFIKIIGIAGGTAAVTGCYSEPTEQVIPHVIPPDDVVPGIPNWYASTCRECPAGCGILVKNREGRAIKVEGNSSSPINRGKTCARGQAGLQGLYNPDRTRSPLRKNDSGKFEPVGWEAAENELLNKVEELRGQGEGGKIVFLTDNIAGSLDNLVDDWMSAVGGRHITYEPFSYEPLREANRIVFGQDKIPTYKINEADYLLSFGADFIETWLSPVEFGWRYSDGFSYDKDKPLGKFVQVEPRLSITGANADEWIPVKPGAEGFLALAVAKVIRGRGGSTGSSGLDEILETYTSEFLTSVTGIDQDTINRIADEFTSARSGLAIGGSAASASVNATDTLVAINLLNRVAGNVGETIDFDRSLTLSNANSFRDVKSLVDSMSNGEVGLLLVYNANPAFTLPPELKFSEAVSNVPFVVSFSSFMDETTDLADLVLPDHTAYEKWGDYIPKEGVYGLIQPAMNPVFNTKNTGDVILSIAKLQEGMPEGSAEKFGVKDFREYVQNSLKNTGAASGKDFDAFWKQSLEEGLVEVEGFGQRNQEGLSSPDLADIEFSEPQFLGEGEMYFVPYPSYRYYDGRGANKPWLQELPNAITQAVWDSWVEIHPETAKKLGVEQGDFLSIESPYGKIETQAYVYKGIRPDTVAVPIGLGHKNYGRYAKERGVNPIEILPAATDKKSGGFAWLSTKVKISKTGKTEQLVQTQYSTDQGKREIAQTVALSKLKDETHHEEHHEEPYIYPDLEYPTHRWGMSIDLSKCTGCGACVTACYAENNIPFVGKEQIARRREMSWIRIERYFEGESDDKPDIRFIPMLCQHCGNAPCEPVCPVFATYHNPEGLNGMIYNRCVGTRYCSNNCTYKVRRFNWFTYTWPEPLNWQLNPDVTVRTKGVMEKCTFCVQRINHGKRKAKDEGRELRDGEILTACQQACPTTAIVFGDLKDKDSKVSRLSSDEKRGYKVLEEVNTKPAITYLKEVNWDKS